MRKNANKAQVGRVMVSHEAGATAPSRRGMDRRASDQLDVLLASPSFSTAAAPSVPTLNDRLNCALHDLEMLCAAAAATADGMHGEPIGEDCAGGPPGVRVASLSANVERVEVLVKRMSEVNSQLGRVA